MSAEILRRAAGAMRLRALGAESTSPSPWTTDSEVAQRMPAPFGVIYLDNGGRAISVAESYSMAEVSHIASWHPAVALAVADWLEVAAERMDVFGDESQPKALAVARAYLGESA